MQRAFGLSSIRSCRVNPFAGLVGRDDGLPEHGRRLVAAGYLLASRELDADAPPEEGAKVGAYVAVGYLLAVVFGSQLFTFTDTGARESFGVAFSQAVLLPGLLYPVLFGALGGYLAFRK